MAESADADALLPDRQRQSLLVVGHRAEQARHRSQSPGRQARADDYRATRANWRETRADRIYRDQPLSRRPYRPGDAISQGQAADWRRGYEGAEKQDSARWSCANAYPAVARRNVAGRASRRRS